MPEHSFDDWMDTQLRNVPLPANLLARLSENGPSAVDVAQLDVVLRAVPVPANLEDRLRRIPRRYAPPPFWRQVGMAASVFLVIGLGAIGAVGYLGGAFDTAPQVATRQATPAPAIKQPPQLARSTPKRIEPANQRPVPVPEVEPAMIEAERLAAIPTSPAPRALEPVEQQPAAAPIVDTKLTAPNALGAGGMIDRLPDLETFDAPVVRGAAPPAVRGYDLMFQLKHGEHPVVELANSPELAATKMPFTFRTSSYDAALEAVDAGRLPAPDEIRVEDFLAAQSFDFADEPAAGLALHVAGSESPLPRNGAPAHLLHLAVQGHSYDNQQHAANRLIVAVDTSALMRSATRLAAVRRALAKLAAHMSQNDRVTLVRFAEKPSVIAQAATAAELNALAASDALTAPTGSANLPNTIAAMCEVARDTQSLEPRQLVIITGERGNYDPAALPKTIEQLTALAKMNVAWRIVRLAGNSKDAHWSKLTAAGGGNVVAAESPDDIYEAMFSVLARWPTTVAKQVAVSMSFNPQEVASYRLVGHDAVTLTGLSPDPVTVDLKVDQDAVCLYEVSLKPGTGKVVAMLEITWQHPPTGQAQWIKRPILREQLAGSFAQAPPWFQHGVVAAKTAEYLRGSYYLPTSRGAGPLLEVAGSVDSRLAERPDFQRLIELLKKAGKLR